LAVTGCSSIPAASTSTGSPAPNSAAAQATKSDPVAWSGTFCEGVTPTLEGLVEVLKSAFQETPDLVAQKAAMLNYATKAGSAMTETAKKLETLGAPTAQAETLHKELIRFFSENGTTLTKVKTDLATIDPAAPDFLEQVGKLGEGADQGKLQEQIKKLTDDPTLKEAFTKAPQCVDMSEKMKGLGTDLLGK
jgi:hypothetical protein